MNYKTTFGLILLIAAAGGGAFYFYQTRPREAVNPSAEFFTQELKPDALTVIKVTHGKKSYVLERQSAKEEWSLPGKWPSRDVEVAELVKTITSIHPRFEPYALDDKKELLAKDPLVLKVTVDGKEHTIKMAEQPRGTNPFIRPTYARLDDQDEVLRLAPGLIAALDHDQEYFRKRRLFDKERPTAEGPDRSDQIAATAVFITRTNPERITQLARWAGKLVALGAAPLYSPYWPMLEASARLEKFPQDARYGLVKNGDEWELSKPARDRIDPDKAKVLLAGLANLWAESFVKTSKTDEEMGLTHPYMTIDVTRPSGTHLEVQVGKYFRFEEQDGPPNKFGMPQKRKVRIEEETRFARLKNHDLVFEIKLDKLDDAVLPLDPDSLRDLQLARFKADDVRKLDVHHGDQTVTLIRTGEPGKEVWKIEPGNHEAEDLAVDKLVRELADLRIKGVNDIVDSAEPGKYGLGSSADVVKVWAVETPKDENGSGEEDKKKKIERTFTFRLGTSPADKGDMFVQMKDWPRINRFHDADLLKLVDAKPTLALGFRKRQLLDVKPEDLARIDVQQGKGGFSLTRADKAWHLAEPVKAELDAKKLGGFPDSLARLRAVEFVAAPPRPEDLDKVYGLATPTLKATLQFSADLVRPSQILIIGKAKDATPPREVGKKDEPVKKDEKAKKDTAPALFYARLDQGPIFLIGKELHDELSRDSVAYRSNVIWSLKPAEIAQISIRKGDDEYRLQRDKEGWKVEAPFNAGALSGAVANLTREIADLKATEYVANVARDLVPYGLDKPSARVHIAVEKKAGAQKPQKSAYTLLMGKERMGGGRFARLEGSDSVFVLGDERTLTALATPVYDLLDRTLLKLDPAGIETIRVHGITRETTYSLAKNKDSWQLIDSLAPAFIPGEEAREDFVRTLADIQAQKIVAHGPKIDWAKYGLAKPAFTIAVTVRQGDKTETHTLAVGGDAGLDQRYARIDDQPAVAVLGQVLLRELGRNYLDFVDVKLPRFPADEVTGFSRTMLGGEVSLVKKGPAWYFAKPERPADAATVNAIVQRLGNLSIQRVAAYPAKDLAPFGLDKPVVVAVRVSAPGEKGRIHVIKIGSASRGPKRPDDLPEGNYAMVDGSLAVVVLSPTLSKLLLARTANFGDHNLTNIPSASVDEVILFTPRTGRRVVFKRIDGLWKMTEPIASPAEALDLAGLVRSLSRLRAEEILADNVDAKDLKNFGLDPARVECRLSSMGKPLLKLALGGSEKSKDKSRRHYARLLSKERPVLFLLGAEPSAELQQEYRNRKPWSEFDPAQVEKISIAAGPGKSFTLVLAGKDWLVQDKVVRRADPKLVAETLDTMVRLETTQYLADTRAPLPLYGLAPPAFTVELDLPTGKRALLIGRLEGTSAGYYANVTGSDAVFLLSADDARRIMRPAAAYLAKGKE